MQVLKTACLAAVAVTLVVSGLSIAAERRVATVALAANGDPPARDAMLAEARTWAPGSIPARAAIGLTALWLRKAGEATAPAPRQNALAQARAMLAIADAGRPHAAATLLLHTQLALVEGQNPSRRATRAFAASYAAAPFLTSEGFWRTAYAANYWKTLSPATRDAAIEEAVWLAGLDGRFNDRLAAILGGSPMAVRYALRTRAPH